MTERVTLRVEGMGCGGCEATVAAAVKGACAQAAEVAADHQAGTVSFTCPCPDNLPAVRAAITAAGYVAAG